MFRGVHGSGQIGNDQTISIGVSPFNKPESKRQVPASQYAEVLNDRQAVTRFADCVLQSGIELPHRAIMANIGSAVDLLVHIGRTKGQRAVSEIAAMRGFDNERNDYKGSKLA